ncbi:DUF4383 domain-containing protein [Nocardioides kongjuensis]|uniref:DUF4383 domain-containing protein n=1 Tax=Nocardioides kongjuensis TaxID=349522 RepID=A0A852RGY3_9ACTN|nr:DUF4383 domain-containing protein [Nocardioides kongjuensis]NYD32821.1 hypothetical protein [Nocardioides kongjuensis]
MNTSLAPTAMTTLSQKAAAVVAGTFVLVGILGFVPGITTRYDEITFAGHESGAQLLDLFAVSVLHNIVHLAFGVAGFLLATSWTGARAFLIGGGAVYLLLTIYGLLVDRHEDANVVPLDKADNWLHLVLGLGMIGLGLFLGRDDNEATDPR